MCGPDPAAEKASSAGSEVAAEAGVTVEPAPVEAGLVFGDQVGLARQFARFLAEQGVLRGLIGPREPGRLWTRHLLNCAVIADLIPAGSRVIDVGSGAGLPGLVLAIHRPDLRLCLLEPMRRRCDFLTEAVHLLGVADRVEVVCGRAEDPQARAAAGLADWVTARAVAPLPRLVGWCLPLLAVGGSVAAIKGSRAADELAAADETFRAAAVRGRIARCGVDVLADPTTVIVVEPYPGSRVTDRRARGARTPRRQTRRGHR